MKKISIGQRMYVSIISIFLVFAVSFMIFQQKREKEFKVKTLNLQLQDYNARMREALQCAGEWSESSLGKYVKEHSLPNLRVTLIDRDGRVFFDNVSKDYVHIHNHKNRKEIKEALSSGAGSDISRVSGTLKKDYFYSATYFPKEGFIIRSALPYNNNLTRLLQVDQHYLWFALTVMVVLTVVLYRFTSRLGDNITKLRTFASRADHNESLDTEDLVGFPNDELGEIAERIVKLYKRLQATKEEQNVLKRQLTQNIAHELKTPVASIQGYLETILNSPTINEETRHLFLERSYAQTQRLASLLQDISTLNRMDDAPDLQTFETVDISNIVSSITKEIALQLEKHRMTFCNLLPGGIIVRGNPSLLYSVFRNLIDNAIYYAGEGTSVTLNVCETESQYIFTFYDNGVGVKADHLPRLFERFYRVDKGRSRKMGGTGLGLAIVKNAVLLHGGSIAVMNREEGGLRFDFSISK